MKVTPVHGFHSFSQPAARQTLIMHEDKRGIGDQRKKLKMLMMHGKVTVSGEDQKVNKAVSNMGRVRGNGPRYPPPRRLGWPSQAFWGGWQGERRATRTTTS